jgi:hypothetical protein
MNEESTKGTIANQVMAAIDAVHVRTYRLSVIELPELLVLRGRVRSYYQKQVVQETAMKLLKQQGFRLTIKNEIVVESP